MKIYLILLSFLLSIASSSAMNEEVLVKLMEQVRNACHPQFPDLPGELLDKLSAGIEPDVAPTDLKVMDKICFANLVERTIMLSAFSAMQNVCSSTWRCSTKRVKSTKLKQPLNFCWYFRMIYRQLERQL